MKFDPDAGGLRDVAKVGDEVRLTLRSKSSEEGGTHLAWTAIHSDAKGRAIARLVHDLDKGYLP